MDSLEVIDDANCSSIFLSEAPITVGVLQLHTVAVSIARIIFSAMCGDLLVQVIRVTGSLAVFLPWQDSWKFISACFRQDYRRSGAWTAWVALKFQPAGMVVYRL